MALARLFYVTVLPFPSVQPTSALSQEALELRSVGGLTSLQMG